MLGVHRENRQHKWMADVKTFLTKIALEFFFFFFNTGIEEPACVMFYTNLVFILRKQ